MPPPTVTAALPGSPTVDHSGECSLLGGLVYPADPTTDRHAADQADPMTETVEDRLRGFVRTAVTC
jgi:hypothetical protein